MGLSPPLIPDGHVRVVGEAYGTISSPISLKSCLSVILIRTDMPSILCEMELLSILFEHFLYSRTSSLFLPLPLLLPGTALKHINGTFFSHPTRHALAGKNTFPYSGHAWAEQTEKEEEALHHPPKTHLTFSFMLFPFSYGVEWGMGGVSPSMVAGLASDLTSLTCMGARQIRIQAAGLTCF